MSVYWISSPRQRQYCQLSQYPNHSYHWTGWLIHHHHYDRFYKMLASQARKPRKNTCQWHKSFSWICCCPVWCLLQLLLHNWEVEFSCTEHASGHLYAHSYVCAICKQSQPISPRCCKISLLISSLHSNSWFDSETDWWQLLKCLCWLNFAGMWSHATSQLHNSTVSHTGYIITYSAPFIGWVNCNLKLHSAPPRLFMWLASHAHPSHQTNQKF